MNKFVLFAAVLAIAPSLAFAGEAKKAAPAIKATQMSDAEMDKITAAGAADIVSSGGGVLVNIDNGTILRTTVTGAYLNDFSSTLTGPGGQTGGINPTTGITTGGTGGRDLLGTGPGGSGFAATPGGIHGGCSPSFPC